MTFLWVAIAGALGTAARHGLALAWPARPGAFPIATFSCNVLGSFAIGIVVASSSGASVPAGSVDVRRVCTAGFLGGFTTYSAMNQETVAFATQGAFVRAGLYLGATVVACLAAGFVGLVLGRALAR